MERYYIGIDIGDGETAVAYLTEDAVAPQMVNLGYPNYSILSAVGKDASGRLAIGDNAMLNAGGTGQTVRFKSRFLTDEQAKEDILHFAQGLAQALQEHSGLMSPQAERRLIVGCPTGAEWTEERRREYAEIIGQALPVQPVPVGESRAAFLYTRYGGDANIPQKLLNQTVLVIDMGSSTTDLAYIIEGREQHVDVFGSAHLGGGLLDSALLDACVARSDKRAEIEDLFRRVPSVRHRCEVTARRIKEEYFSAQGQGKPFSGSAFQILYYGKTRADYTRLDISADDRAMEALLSGKIKALGNASYQDSVRDLLKNARQVTKKQPPDLVILTGGASKMRFFQQAVQTAFPNAIMACCDKPEYSIARGLAFACRVDDRMEKFREAIARFTASPDYDGKLSTAVSDLADRLAAAFAPLYIDCLFAQKGAWDNQSFLNKEEVKTAFHSALESWGREGLNAVNDEIRNICRRFKVVDEAKMPIPKPETLPVTLPTFSLTGMVRVIGRLPVIGPLVKKRYVDNANDELRSMLKNPSGAFYLALCAQLKKELKDDIDRRAREVEIPIV